MDTFSKDIETDLIFIEKAGKYLTTSLSQVNREHIPEDMKQKIFGIVDTLVNPTQLLIKQAVDLHSISLSEQSELLVWVDDIKKRLRSDLERLFHNGRSDSK
jgi:hypothetical protein